MKRIGLIVLLSALVPLAPTAAQNLLWSRQFGSVKQDSGEGVAVDSAGNAYITGIARGELGGTSWGWEDAFLAKYDASGALLWTHQFGAPGGHHGHAVAVDSAGNAYVTGLTWGSLGGSNAGGADVFLAKYDASGLLLWTRQTGTSEDDNGNGVAVDSAGNAYITGATRGPISGIFPIDRDVFLSKYDASGVLLWTREFGTPDWEEGTGVAVDSAGNAYITGFTHGSLGGTSAGYYDYFLAKYDASGALLWMRQAGTSKGEGASGVAVDSAGNAYITGGTQGSLFGPFKGGWGDYFLAKYDASGAVLWTRQDGTWAGDQGTGVAVDSAGNAYITGETYGRLGGYHAGQSDVFLAKYDASGVLRWTLQIGTQLNQSGRGVAVDSASSAYVTGYSWGRFAGLSAGELDAFLLKYGDVSCYADCDVSTGAGVLDVFDFLCFQNSFVNGEPYACDCDTSTGPLVCDVFDFLCFQNAFVSGCP